MSDKKRILLLQIDDIVGEDALIAAGQLAREHKFEEAGNCLKRAIDHGLLHMYATWVGD